MRHDIESIMTRDVVTIEEEHTISDAVKAMEEHDISCLVITKGQKPLGMVTEKDMTRRAIAKNLNPKTTKISEIMSSPIISAPKTKSLSDVTRMFREFGFRRIPIMDNGKLVGIVTTTDISNQTSLMYDINNRILYHQKVQTVFMILAVILLLMIIFFFVRGTWIK
jgi:CBS domain-containing protein